MAEVLCPRRAAPKERAPNPAQKSLRAHFALAKAWLRVIYAPGQEFGDG
jgi:hypothetical protein